MDSRLLQYYNRELQYIREMGGEFAEQFPKIAGRLGLDAFECNDPYVERLLEGFAFLAARVQLKLDSEFPQFTQHLLEMVYPDYLGPTPSMAVVRYQPDPDAGSLLEGVTIPRGTALRGTLGTDDQTACEYRSAHPVTLWPIEIGEVRYFSRDVASIPIPPALREESRAGVRLRLKTMPGVTFQKLSLDDLQLYVRGREETPMHLYEQFFASSIAVLVRSPDAPGDRYEVLDETCIREFGFDDEQALLPYCNRSFQGYRLIREYFAFHQRFMFVNLTGIGDSLRRVGGKEVEILVLFDRMEPALENVVDRENFSLFCTPAVNLFPKLCDTIHVRQGQFEHHVVPDRTRPLDFEVYRVTSAIGRDADSDEDYEFFPFYASLDQKPPASADAFYTVRRVPRKPSTHRQPQRLRSDYVGTEMFLTLVDHRQQSLVHNTRDLMIKALCTNRNLPETMPVGRGGTDFTLEIGAPVLSIRCVAGPTEPRPSYAFAQGDVVWRLVNHLTLNYLSLVDNDQWHGAAALREMLRLYADLDDAGMSKQIDGVRSIASRPIIRRLPVTGPVTMGRGLEVTLRLDETAFEGCGVFLLGAVLERFFAKHVSINSFTETVLRTEHRHEIKRWPMKIGRRHIL